MINNFSKSDLTSINRYKVLNNKNRDRRKTFNLKIFHQNGQLLDSRIDILQLLLDAITTDVLVQTQHQMINFEISRLN